MDALYLPFSILHSLPEMFFNYAGWTLPFVALMLSQTQAERTPAYLGVNATMLRQHAVALMRKYPLIDCHVDLPFISRSISRQPLLNLEDIVKGYPGHVDVPRMEQGHLGGIFMVAWTPCPDTLDQDPGPYFLIPTDSVRDTLEALDIIQEMVVKIPKFELAKTSADIRHAFANGKIATLMAVEGGHQLGNSLSALRLYAKLGVRYVTLTHTCHNAFASSAGSGSPLAGSSLGSGLTSLGREMVLEMNRLGVLVDLSHVSDHTMKEAIQLSQAPVIFSHSGARAVLDHPRNVPDEVLRMIGDGEAQNSGVVLSVFYPPFIDPLQPTVSRVADHIVYIASIVGKRHVGIASDFDGMQSSVTGLEDASQYPNLIMELLARDWTDSEIADVMGGNLMRAMDEADTIKSLLRNQPASPAVYERRVDLPAKWAGPNDVYLPEDVKRYIDGTRSRDEL